MVIDCLVNITATCGIDMTVIPFKRPTKEEANQQMLDEIADSKKAIFDLIEHNEMSDDDGYPTEAALDVIELWHWTDAKGWFKFIEGLWMYRNWGWSEYDAPHQWYKDKIVHRYDISTAGWSGNESIIHAMNHNEMMWHLNWVQSQRGGHHIFELKEFNDD
jgi:hypothetical protein